MRSLIMGSVLCVLLGVQGCSHRQIYQSFQENGKIACGKRPTSDEYAACMRQYEEPYDSYKRTREEEHS